MCVNNMVKGKSGEKQMKNENNMVVNFPDKNLEAVIRLKINKPTGDILASDLVGIKSLRASNKKISNITGLEYCTALTDLYLYNNKITDISPLSELTELIYLSLNDNSISDINPLRGLIKLTELYLDGNSISDISTLSRLTGLIYLYLDYNKITDISSLSGLTKLTSLVLNYNDMEIKPGTAPGQTNLDIVNWHLDNGCYVGWKHGNKTEKQRRK